MKFGLLSFGNTVSNLGDWVQSLGVIKVYQYMGIAFDELVLIDRHKLRSYQGEKVVLPMGGYFDKVFGIDFFPLSDDIIPAFFGFHCTDEKILKLLGEYKNFFFGCRDLATADSINKSLGYSDKIFMSGCFSLCLDRRKLSMEPEKIYLVDAIPELSPYIPNNIRDQAINLTQIYSRFTSMNDEEANRNALEATKEWLGIFYKTAKLVITSRLHLALPCAAMGIPVIVARRYYDDTDRYSGYEALFHVYMPHEFSEINWTPPVHDIEWLKEEIITNAVSLIHRTASDKKLNVDFIAQYIQQIKKADSFFKKASENTFYCMGPQASYLSQAQKQYYFENIDKYNNILEYIINDSLCDRTLVIWGAGDKGFWMMRRYEHIVKQFKKCFYVDKNTEKQNGRLNGFPVLEPKAIQEIDRKKILIIIAVKSYDSTIGREIAKELSCSYNFKEGKEFLFLDKLDSSARMAIDDIALNSSLM